MMIKRIPLATAALVALVIAGSAGATSRATITISHVERGCHSWQFNGGKIQPSLSVTLKAGTVLRFVNNDVMAHKLIQTAGPRLTLVRPNLNHVGASTTVAFTKKGVYRFTTKVGEDYKWAAGTKTIGADHVLHLKLLVK